MLLFFFNSSQFVYILAHIFVAIEHYHIEMQEGDSLYSHLIAHLLCVRVHVYGI